MNIGFRETLTSNGRHPGHATPGTLLFTVPMRVPLGALPVVTYILVAYQLLPRTRPCAPVRLALVRAAVLVGGYAVLLVEVLSVFHALTLPAFVAGWLVAMLAAFTGATRRYRRRGRRPDPIGRLPGLWADTGLVERVLMVALVGLVAAELLVAIVSPPNNYDSQTYHLPKIEHWVAQRDVGFYPTSIDRQLSIAPGAEYLLLNLRLLTGGDTGYNLLQLAAGVGCALLAARIAGQLGGSRRAQLLAAFVISTAPIVALESTSTQTDLVVAAWVGCVATLVLDELGRRTPAGNLVLLGTGTGLTVLTKATGGLAVGLMLLVWLIAALRRGVPRALAGGLVVGVVALILAGPYVNRVNDEYANPLGPDSLRNSISMQRHDPPSVLVNALRIAQTALQTPVGPLNDVTAAGIEGLSRAMGIDPNDRQITFWGSTFPSLSWPPDEDRASFPVQGALVLLGAGFLLVRPGRRVYALVFWLVLLCYVTTVKWQPWGNRLILFILVLGAPLAGLWLDALFRRATNPVEGSRPDGAATHAWTAGSRAFRAWTAGSRAFGAWTAVAALMVGGCAGWLAVGYGWPRRLVGPGSVFTVTDMQARFVRRPQWQADYEWAAAAVRASGAHRIGLVQGYDTWEYPWWVLLRGDDIVSLQSQQAGIAPARPDTVDAIVCVSSSHLCAYYVPKGWAMRMRDGIGYALPPGR
jgi:hypothetical protein